ncbi:hypothetical protein MNBD_GAMMA06-835 [hydrothermal vent metagenome]|uniref:Uracil-DNA glycosylase-like domain-containing protein n=1 Tax=hydrothermal vent metagenome TaxID=652676 RepID=A0A3B0WEI2_9ZZZZ
MVNETTTLDENTRRYYLKAMGIQCWQLLDVQHEVENQSDVLIGGDSDYKDSDYKNNDYKDNSKDVAITDYSQIENAIQQCTKCSLHKTRKQTVHKQAAGCGNQSADLMLVMLSPPSVDEANTLLSKMLAAINININDIYLSSLLKCSVPENYVVAEKEIQACNDFLVQQIKFIQPKIIVVLGEEAACWLLQKNLSMDDFRAANNEIKHQITSVPVFISYSPEELLQQAENKRKAWSDLQQLQKSLNSKM